MVHLTLSEYISSPIHELTEEHVGSKYQVSGVVHGLYSNVHTSSYGGDFTYFNGVIEDADGGLLPFGGMTRAGHGGQGLALIKTASDLEKKITLWGTLKPEYVQTEDNLRLICLDVEHVVMDGLKVSPYKSV